MTTKDSPLELDEEGRAKPMAGMETLLLDKVKTGEYAHVHDGPSPDQENGWQDCHTIRGAFLRHLCQHVDVYKIDPRGIWLSGARIFGPLDLEAADLERPLWISAARFTDTPILRDATTRALSLQHCHLPGLQADRLTVTGTLRLNASTFGGEVRLSSAHITGSLSCANATFDNAGGNAFSADRLVTCGDMVFDTLTARGETRLLGADITGDLDCENATFDNAGGNAFSVDRLKCGGTVILRSVTARGVTRLLGADITGDLDCANATFDNAGGDAFSADGVKISGAVFLRSATSRGETRLLGAHIAGNLECDNATFDNAGDDAFSGERMRVHGRLFWREFTTPPRGEVNFIHAQIGDFFDDGTGWPDTGPLQLDGFCYENLGLPTTAGERCDWLARMPDSLGGGEPVFWPQPYEQLIKVLRAAGHERDARKIAIAKVDAYRRFLKAQDDYQDVVHKIKDATPDKYREFNRDKGVAKIVRAYATRTPNLARRIWFGFLKAVAGILLAGGVLVGGTFNFRPCRGHNVHAPRQGTYLCQRQLHIGPIGLRNPRLAIRRCTG